MPWLCSSGTPFVYWLRQPSSNVSDTMPRLYGPLAGGFGGVVVPLLTVTWTVAVVLRPALLRAVAEIVCVPSVTVFESQVAANGAARSSVPIGWPSSTGNPTPTVSELAVAVSPTVLPETVALAAGAVTLIVGAPGGGVVLPDSATTKSSVCSVPLAAITW